MTNANLEKLAKELKGMKVMKKELDAEIDALESKIKAEMVHRNSESITVGDYELTYKPVTSHRFDSKAFKAVHEDLYKLFSRASTSMRFTCN